VTQLPKDRPQKREAEGLRPLPKPIQLDLPTERPKPKRRLHEQEIQPEQHVDYEEPRPKKKSETPAGNRYFKSAQKAYGQRRRKPKSESPPPKKRTQKSQDSARPRLGQGDRLYTPPMPKEPLIPPSVRRVLRLWALGLIAVAFIVLVLISMLRNNAWAVFLDDRFIGYMPINREVEPYTIHDSAVQHLSDTLGAVVVVNEQTSIRETRASRGDINIAMITYLSSQFIYQIEAAAIYVDGEFLAALRNVEDAEHVAREIQRPFINPENHIISADFEEDWQIRTRLVNSLEETGAPSAVIQLLERPASDIIYHNIRSGDTQGDLAIEFGTTLERIGELNDIGLDTILRVGETLRIEITRPRLTVRTVEEITIIEDIPMDVVSQENPDLHVSVTNVLSEGRYGEREVRQRITRVNGVAQGDPEIIDSNVLRPPETRYIEVGTSDSAVEVR